jgi:hypothetical protein
MIPPDDDRQAHEAFYEQFKRDEREADESDDSEALWNATGRG